MTLNLKTVFVFTREREKEASSRHLHNLSQLPLIHAVIDAAYDLHDGSGELRSLYDAIENAMINGGGGVWEQAGTWLAKLSPHYTDLDAIWHTLATYPKAPIRFRAAAHVCEMSSVALELNLPLLLRDRSRNVRDKVAGDLWVSPRCDAVSMIRRRLQDEPDAEIAMQLREAISKCCG
jgi:hypothetical protein